MEECVNLTKCGFFEKYCSTKDLTCKSFIAMYCRGDKKSECKRLEFKLKHGAPPLDNMMPSGQLIK